MDTNHEFERLREAYTRQNQLFQFALHKKLCPAAFPELSFLIDTSFAVIDFHGKLVFNNTGLSDEAIMQRWPWNDRPVWISIDDTQFHRRTLSHEGNRLGNVVFKQEHPMSQERYDLLSYAAWIIAPALVKPWEAATSDFAGNDFETMLSRHLTGEISFETLVEYAVRQHIPLPPKSYYCVLLCNANDRKDPGLRAGLAAIKASISQFLHIEPHLLTPASIHHGQLLIVPADSGYSLNTMKHAFENSLSKIGDSLDSVHWRIAVSWQKESMKELEGAVHECVDVIRVVKGLAIPGRVHTFNELEFAYLFEGMPRERMVRYNRIIFKSLHDSTNSRDKKLLKTLQAYIQNEASIPAAARSLGLHRNTLAYRLDQATALIGVDLKKSSDLLRLQLAFTLRLILHRTELDSEPKEQ